MKKPSLNKDAIQQFFLANGEKLLLGATVVVLLGFFYSALTAKPLDETMSPEAIKTASNSLQTQIGNPTWEEKKKELNLASPEFPNINDRASKPVPVTAFRQPREWDPALFPELKRRADPKIFAVEELQAAGGAGLLAYQIAPDATGMTPAPAPTNERGTATTATTKRIDPTAPLPGAHVQGAEASGKPYVIVTALVPVDKQALEYTDRFALSMPPVPDPNLPAPINPPQPGMPEVPVYAVCLVQRREVSAGMKTDGDWPALPYNDVIKDIRKWAPAWSGQDIVDLNYVFPQDEIPFPGGDGQQTLTRLITMQLPPLLLKDWGLEAAHPKIRLNIPDDATTTQGVNIDTPQPDLNFGEPGGMKAAPGTGAPGPAPAQRMAPPVQAVRPAPPPRGVTLPPRGRSDHDEKPSYGGGFRPQVPQVNYNTPAAAQAPSVPNKLFRFVDFSVEPGKTYQYRVQLVVVNPNYGLKPDCLETADTSKVKWLKSPVSEPTAPITVPRLYQILAENLTGGSRGAEPKAKINFLALFKVPASETAVVPTPGREVWVEGMKEIDQWTLGSILVVRDQDFTDVVDPAAMELRNVKATVETDQPMLLDVRNEEPLGSSKSKWPTEMLVIDAAGRLSVASSAVDHFAADEFTAMKKNATTQVTGGPGYGGTINEHDQPKPAPAPPRKRNRED